MRFNLNNMAYDICRLASVNRVRISFAGIVGW